MQLHLAGDHVDCARADLDDADRAHGAAARRLEREPLEDRSRLGGACEGVPSQRHRCRSGVCRSPVHPHEQVVGRGDVRHHPDRDAGGLEHAGLLDVQLDEGVHGREVQPRLLDPIRVQADGTHRRGDADAVAIAHRIELGPRQAAGERAAAQATRAEARLLAGEADHLDATCRRPVRRAEGAERLDRPEHTEHTVVGPGIQRRVDVRAGEDSRRGRVVALDPAPEIAERVDAHVEPGLSHQVGDELVRGRVGGGEHLARDPAGVRVVVEAGEVLQLIGDRACRQCENGHGSRSSVGVPRR